MNSGGIEYEAEIYWTTARYVSDAKRLGVYLTSDDIRQIQANALALNASRHASVRRCAKSLPVVIVAPTGQTPTAS